MLVNIEDNTNIDELIDMLIEKLEKREESIIVDGDQLLSILNKLNRYKRNIKSYTKQINTLQTELHKWETTPIDTHIASDDMHCHMTVSYQAKTIHIIHKINGKLFQYHSQHPHVIFDDIFDEIKNELFMKLPEVTQ
jgi:hypothetical protein